MRQGEKSKIIPLTVERNSGQLTGKRNGMAKKWFGSEGIVEEYVH